MEPGAERRIASERAEFLPRAHEHVLRHFVGLVASEHPPHKVVDPGDVQAVEALEGGGIPPGRKGHISIHAGSKGGLAVQRHHRVWHGPVRSTGWTGGAYQKVDRARHGRGGEPPERIPWIA